MAIKTGSGGLKYPLPNAQITAQQSAAAASAGGSASASAYGANRRFAGQKLAAQVDILNAERNRQFQAQQAYLDRGFRAEQAYFGREHDKGAQLEAQRAAAERQQAGFDQQTALQGAQQEFIAGESQLDRQNYLDRDRARFEQDQIEFEKGIDAQIEENRRLGRVHFAEGDEKVLRELDRVLKEDKGLDPQQRAEVEAERRRILREGARPGSGPGTGQFNQGTTFVDEETGIGYATPDAGPPGKKLVPYNSQNRTRLVEQPDTSKQDQALQKRQESIAKSADELEKIIVTEDTELPDGTVVKKGSKPTQQQALQMAKQRQDTRDAFFNPAAPPEQQAPAQGQPGPAPIGGAPPGSPGSPQPIGGAPPGPPEVQQMAQDVRTEVQNVPLDPKTETPQLRQYMDQHLEEFMQYANTPIDQVPEAARPHVDFLNRLTQSSVNKQPVVLRTPEEAAMLPPGTEFIDPNGQKRKVPS